MKTSSPASSTLDAVPRELHDSALVDIRVVAGLLGLKSKNAVRARIGRPGGFPDPIRLSSRCTRWRLGDIRAYIAATQSAQGGKL
jgi:predicted DNA-binding transcriptional regulator AlpA